MKNAVILNNMHILFNLSETEVVICILLVLGYQFCLFLRYIYWMSELLRQYWIFLTFHFIKETE
jgi:hypothetical protein